MRGLKKIKDKQTDTRTDSATTRPKRPTGGFGENRNNRLWNTYNTQIKKSILVFSVQHQVISGKCSVFSIKHSVFVVN